MRKEQRSPVSEISTVIVIVTVLVTVTATVAITVTVMWYHSTVGSLFKMLETCEKK
jgi:hypothetical protein